MARQFDLTRCGSSFEADESIVSVLPRANRAFTGTRLRIPHCIGSNSESVMLAPRVNASNHLRARATEMRASSKELKDNNNAAVIMRLADLYDRLADRAETRGNHAVPDGAKRKEGDPSAWS